MQSLPLSVKLVMTEQRIRGWYNAFDGVYVSRSGGKDSDVLGHIIQNMGLNIPHVFVNTGLEWDSVRKHAMEVSDVVLKPKMTFLEVLIKYGYPVISKEVAAAVRDARSKPYGASARKFDANSEKNQKYPQFSLARYKYLIDAPFKISHYCCNVMKKNPAKEYERETGNKPFIATLAMESKLRKTKWLEHGCNAFDVKRPTSQPLSFWTENDILQYIKENNIKLADIYGDVVYEHDGFYYYDNFLGTGKLTTTGAKRTGCVFCLFGITQDPNRLLLLKEKEPRKYEYVMNGGHFENDLWTPDKNGLGYKFVVDWLNEHGNLNIRY